MLTTTKRRFAKGKRGAVKRISAKSRPADSKSKTVSARFPRALLNEASHLRPGENVSSLMLEAFSEWIQHLRRQREDEVIAQEMASISTKQRDEERGVVRTASRSALRIAERTNG